MTRAADPPRGAGKSRAIRALDVLSAFSADRVELSLSEIGRRSGLPLTTTHRLVGELTGWGALERTETGSYRVGLRLWEIASLAPRSVGLRETAMPFLEDLYEATRQNVQLAVLDGNEVVYVERISARTAVNVVTRVGSRLPLHATGVGLVLLAFADPAFQEEILAGPLKQFTTKTLVSPTALRRTLAEVRKTSTAISDGQITLDALSIAAPIRDAGDRVIAALSVVVPAENSAQPYIPAVHAAARGISRRLGWTPPHGRELHGQV